MAQKTVNYKGYPIGTKVYAISEYRNGEKDTHHYAIFPAIVHSITFSHEEPEYWLTTPKGDDWGNTVPESKVSNSFNDLTNRLKLIWEEHSNTF